MMYKLKKKRIVFSLLLGFVFLMNACSKNEEIKQIKSPNAAVQLSLDAVDGNLIYMLNWNNEMVVDASVLSIKPNSNIEIIKTETKTLNSTWKPVWGQFSEIQDHYNELVLTLKVDEIQGKLYARAYNEGIGFRFELDNVKPENQFNFYSEYNLAKNDVIYYPSGEAPPKGPLKIQNLTSTENKKQKFHIPIVVETASQKHLSILESDLVSSRGFKTMKVDFDNSTEKLISVSEIKNQKGKLITPWKVILVGETAGDLVTNSVTLNLATPNKIENTDWIKPGKTLWDWRVHGYTAKDGFVYGVNTESYKRFIDFAAEKKIEYFLIDANWYTKTSKGHFEIAKELDLQTVVEYAAEKEVELLLYYDRHKGNYGDDALFPYFNSLNMKGIKYGFMGNNPDFSRDAIIKSAENKLLIDFHDSPVPYTGVSRTYPNAITREYCHAQQDSRKAFTPETFIKMALINAIQGPLDMNNGNFDLLNINSGKRQKGPRKSNTYFSTVTSEVARTLVIFSGLVCIPDAPEAYAAKEDLFEFIQKMPVGKWDETRILNSAMAKNITTARRHGKEWFIGSVIDRKGGTLDINLDFLEEGINYEVTYYEDTPETDCKTNPEAYQIRKGMVTKGELIQAKLAPGGGHCMWIRPEINQ
ncbi:glycoside hydrolase family 97 protein [Polaribacter sp. 20A6]|uniref:glycoside hydrolase family 97 protein n=1 Tax=Polaribacter sp. 20A6 TaxID=2687289 RepID=UPI00197B2A33|nr:glycoside hydrolase family 97 protein [Polaribacter sp. 20A6]